MHGIHMWKPQTIFAIFRSVYDVIYEGQSMTRYYARLGVFHARIRRDYRRHALALIGRINRFDLASVSELEFPALMATW
jgi:hypothetical protein